MLETLDGTLFQPLGEEESAVILGGAARTFCFGGYCFYNDQVFVDYIED